MTTKKFETNTWYTKSHQFTAAAGRITYNPYTDVFLVTVAISGAQDDASWHFTDTSGWAVAAGGLGRAQRYQAGHLNRSDW